MRWSLVEDQGKTMGQVETGASVIIESQNHGIMKVEKDPQVQPLTCYHHAYYAFRGNLIREEQT